MARVRPWLPFAAIIALLLVAGAFLGTSEGGGPPLDPRSARSLGTKALVEVLRGLGATVEVTTDVPGPDTDTALLLADDLSPARRARLAAWVEDGGTLVVADPSSPLNPYEPTGTTDVGFVEASVDRRCNLAALRDVRRVSAPGASVLAVPEGSGATGCFPRGGGYWLVAAAQGRGNLVVVGGAGTFVNKRLGEADDALLAASLLAPGRQSRVAFLQPPPPGSGRAKLTDLVAPRVKSALWQLVIAFGVLALWRGRRLGRPVVEPQPVQLPGSELVTAVGNLLQRAGNREQAAALLRADLRHALADRLGLAPHVGADVLADAAAARTGVARDRIAGALAGPAPSTEAGLVGLAQHVESIRLEVLHG